MAETLLAPAVPARRFARALHPAGRRRWKSRLDRMAVAIIVAAPPAALIAAWLGWMPSR